ncbi:putative Heterokaryon incompatibility domain-containing protein [Seiridium cardinale]
MVTGRGAVDAVSAVFEWAGSSGGYSSFVLHLTYDNTSHKVQLFCPIGSKMEIKYMRSGRVLTGDTSSPVSMDRVRQMVGKCEREHATCRPGRDETLPRRLIDLEMLDHGLDCVRLVQFADIAEVRGTYACLSHCWGQDPMPVTTTMENLDNNIKSIPFCLLPPTFRDAITICRKLGLRYIWIDSLCIIQNSTEDWEIESAKMAGIYQNSFITVAATSSSDFRGGCFQESDADMCFRVKYGAILDTNIAVRDEIIGELSELYPLFTRGWVHQERMLSRRLLYCNRGELQLECREEMACECGNNKIMPPGTNLLERLAAKSRYHRPNGNRLSSSWQTAVMTYTTLGLTKAKDKLPAISGCAKDMRSSERGRYLGGLWEHTLAEELLWVTNNHLKSLRPPDWRAPSWSWASVDAPNGVKFLSGSLGNGRAGGIASMQLFQRKIIEASCEPRGVDETGELKPGSSYLRLRSSLGNAHIRRICYGCLSRRASKGTENRHILEVDSFGGKWEDREHEPCKFTVRGLEKRCNTVSFHPDFRYEKTSLDFFAAENNGHCLLAPVSLLEIIQLASTAGTITAIFLALKRVLEDTEVTYERVGLVEMSFPDRDQLDSWFDQVFKPCSHPDTAFTIV